MYIQAWADKAIKKEVANLLVICENNTAGCQWKGSFKELLVSCNIIHCSHVHILYTMTGSHTELSVYCSGV